MALSRTTRGSGVNIVALGWGLSATLAALVVACALAAMLFPSLPVAHSWLRLFSTAPVGSLWNLAEGIVWSIVAGWFWAVIFGLVYNCLAD